MGAGLWELGIPSLLWSPGIGSDETYPPVCMMKSSWLTVSLPIPALLPPTLHFSRPRSPPPSLQLKNRRDPGAVLNPGLLLARPGHMPIFSGSCPYTREHSQIPEPGPR